jgi:DNA-binding response OmpR family regulator
MRLLVIEDESLVAQDIGWTIESIKGFKLAGIAATVERALAFIRSHEIDGAILDANLDGESSKSVAAELRRKSIPYLILSGCLDRRLLPPPLDRGPLLEKPYSEKDLISRIKSLASAAAAAE